MIKKSRSRYRSISKSDKAGLYILGGGMAGTGAAYYGANKLLDTNAFRRIARKPFIAGPVAVGMLAGVTASFVGGAWAGGLAFTGHENYRHHRRKGLGRMASMKRTARFLPKKAKSSLKYMWDHRNEFFKDEVV